MAAGQFVAAAAAAAAPDAASVHFNAHMMAAVVVDRRLQNTITVKLRVQFPESSTSLISSSDNERLVRNGVSF